jgi:hypothetical protein
MPDHDVFRRSRCRYGGVLHAVARKHLFHARQVGASDLHDRAKLLVEQVRDTVVEILGDIDREADSRGNRHLEQRHEQSAVGAIVVREEQARLAQLALRREPLRKLAGLVEVRRSAAIAAEGLRQAGAAEALPAAGEIDQEEHGVPVARELRRERLPDVARGRERGHDQRHRRRHRAFLTCLLPDGTH